MARKRAKRSSRKADPTPTQPDVDQLKEVLSAYMAQQGLRDTGQRRLIFDAFFKSPGHMSLEEMLSRVRVRDPRIGYATVYRTMKMLVESGVAHERKFAEGITRYELSDVEAHHDHLICLDCGKIVEFKEPRIEKLQEQVALRHGFELRYHKHELYCVCLDKNCPERRKRKQKRR